MSKQLDLDPVRAVSIDPTDLQNELLNLPLLLYRFREAYSEAKRYAESLELQIKEVKGSEFIRVKNEEPKITVDGAKAMVDVSKAVKAANEAWLDARRDADTIYGIVDALNAKLQMLITICANERQVNR